jgi:hypothetical protein
MPLDGLGVLTVVMGVDVTALPGGLSAGEGRTASSLTGAGITEVVLGVWTSPGTPLLGPERTSSERSEEAAPFTLGPWEGLGVEVTSDKPCSAAPFDV